MTLADEAQRQRSRKGPRCDTGLLLDRLTQPDTSEPIALTLAELTEALADPTVHATALSRALRNRGIDLGYWSIARHRRGDCSCR